MKKVSIIVPVYNCEKYIGRCLESLINQTYKNIEILVINDGSTDDTLKILKEYEKLDDRIVLINKKNTGVSDTRNLAIKKSTGDYIAFCDSDDMYELNFIEKSYNYLINNKVNAVRTNYKVIDKDNQYIESGDLSKFNNQVLTKDDIINKLVPSILNGRIPCFSYLLFIERKYLKNIEFPIDIHMMEDVVFYLKVFLNIKKIYVTNEELYVIMFNNDGATNSVKNYERNINNIMMVNHYIRNILKEANIDTKYNVENLNLNHLNAISDFIFKHYLYSKESSIKLCKRLSINNNFLNILKKVNCKKINLQRRLLLKLIKNKLFLCLNVYFKLRKLIYFLKRGKI